jgi:protein SCO1
VLLPALLAVGLCLLCGACYTTVTATDHGEHAGHEALPAVTYSARSVYQLESTWMTAHEQPLRLGHLQGKVQVLAMVYTTCESACPIIISLMQLMSWSLLSWHPDDVMELAIVLGISYKRDQNGGFIHSNVITVLNRAGEIVHRHEGLQQDLASTLEAIRRAVQQ